MPFALKVKHYIHKGERKPGLAFSVVNVHQQKQMENWLQLYTWIFKAITLFYPSCSNIGIKVYFLYSKNIHRKMEKKNLVWSNPKLHRKALWVLWQGVRVLSLPAFLLFAGVISLLHQDPNKHQSKVLVNFYLNV